MQLNSSNQASIKYQSNIIQLDLSVSNEEPDFFLQEN